MIRHKSLVGLALAALTTMGLVGSAAAAEQVNFSGSLEGSEAQAFIDPTHIFGVVTAWGEATQLGRYTLSMPHVVDITTRIGVGTFTFVSAKGDTVVGTMTGQATPISATVISIEEEATITGGTGRFEGATGAFTIHRLHDRVANKTTGTFEGALSSPGSSH